MSDGGFKLGVIVLAHRLPQQLAALLGALRHPQLAVYLHLDATMEREPFFEALGSSHLSEVNLLASRRIRWGGIEMVDVELEGIERALKDGCSYVTVISGQDFPLRPAAEIVAFFEANRTRSFIEADPLPITNWDLGGRDRTEFYPYWIRGRPTACVPLGDDASWMSGKRRLLNWVLRVPTAFRPRRRFPAYVAAYGGSTWVNLTGDAARFLLEFTDAHPDYHAYHRHTMCVDELFIQSVLLGSGFAELHEVVPENLRFIVWDEDDPVHPKTLDAEDLPAMFEGSHLFARKVDAEASPALVAALLERLNVG